MTKVWRFLPASLLGLAACVFIMGVGVAPANAISCTFIGNSTNPDVCTGGTPNTIYGTAGAPNNADPAGGTNTPATSLNGTPLLAKFNNDLTTSGPDVANFTVTISGTTADWAFIGGAGALQPTLLAVKAGNFWYFIDLAGALSGTVTQNLILNPQSNAFLGISHLAFYDHAGVVPLPPAALLFGTALVGMGFLGRRRKRGQAPVAA
jgi:hypothetical protein